ncbi:Repeat domain-containing protein, partial [Paenibacillus sp. UNCCL117]
MELLKTQKGLLVKLAWILVPLFMLHAPLQLHALSFQDVTSYPVDGYPNGITAADFNKDGRTDIAVADTTSHTISVRLGNGDGTFGNSAAYGSGKSPQAIVHGDVNGDGNIDLITVDRDSDSISVFLGNGGGTFANALSFPVGDVSLRLAVGDFNDDNKLDVAVSSLREDAVYILLGIGDGTFAAPVSYAVGDGPYEVLPGDFNGDGKLDLAVANFGSKTVSVLLGNGLGAFAPKVDYGVQLAASGGAAGDLNKDGHLDLVVGDGTLLPGSISVLLGRGDGTFAAAVKYSVGGSDTRAILIEDFTGDGNADVVTGNWSSYNVSVLAGDGTGALAPAVVFDMGGSVTDLISGDFNGDGLRDLAFGRQSGKDFGVRLAIDEIPPVITLNGANPMLMEAGSVFTDPGATAHDGIDGDLTSQITVSGAVDSNRAGTYTLTYEVTDAAGNLATKTRAVQVVDTVAPVLTLNGPNPMQVEAGSAFTDPGATAQDAADGDLTSQITVSGAVDAGQVGTYTLTYQVTDAAGHVAAVTRTVQVVDTTAPVLTLNGPNPMQIEAGSAFTDPGATAQDAADGDLTSQITMSGAVDAGQVGTYTLTYQVTDAAGNLATKTRAVQVVDTVAPVLTLNGPNPMQMEAGSAFTDPGATAQDAADGDLTS